MNKWCFESNSLITTTALAEEKFGLYVIRTAAYLPWRWIWVVLWGMWLMNLCEKLPKNINHRLLKSRLIANDDLCVYISRQAGWQIGTQTHANIFAYAWMETLHWTRGTGETVRCFQTYLLQRIVSWCSVAFLNAMFPLWPPVCERRRINGATYLAICLTNIFKNAHRWCF